MKTADHVDFKFGAILLVLDSTFTESVLFVSNDERRRSQNWTRTSCRLQTRATRCITANVLRANKVDAECDKLATELRWQRLAPKVANCQLPHSVNLYPTCIGASIGVTPVEFCRDFRHQKTRVTGLSCGVVCVILHLAVSVEHRLVTDRRADKHTTTDNTRAS